MASQLDLDQGGTFRQTQKVYMGPSVGWVNAPQQTVLPVTTVGTTIVLRGMSLVLVSVNADGVIIQLPPARATTAGPQAIPQQSVIVPVVVLDQGGYAYAHPIRINPDPAEVVRGIDGLDHVTINSGFGAYVFRPDIINGGWTLLQ